MPTLNFIFEFLKLKYSIEGGNFVSALAIKLCLFHYLYH